MTIRDELAAELRDAMRAGDKPRRDVIRQVETEAALARSAPGFTGEPDDDDLYVKVITAYVKKMDKARVEYLDFGEQGEAMAAKLAYEVDYLSRWLPARMGEEETRALVRAAIAELEAAADPKAAGRVIGQLMKEHKDELDGGLVNRLVKEELAAG
jgi:uncharacterized protein YqeY